MARYFSGQAILDIGYRGGDPNAEPITEHAIGVELDYPGYDGVHLPFPDDSQDTVLAAHVLEPIVDYKPVLRDWLRVLKLGGHMVIMLPPRDLYERLPDLPSRWNGDHKHHQRGRTGFATRKRRRLRSIGSINRSITPCASI